MTSRYCIVLIIVACISMLDVCAVVNAIEPAHVRPAVSSTADSDVGATQVAYIHGGYRGYYGNRPYYGGYRGYGYGYRGYVPGYYGAYNYGWPSYGYARPYYYGYTSPYYYGGAYYSPYGYGYSYPLYGVY